MINTRDEYIICAAIWYKDGTEAPRGFIAQNINSGVVIGQWRHYNCVNVRATNPLWNAKKLAERRGEHPLIEKWEDTLPYYDEVYGFLTSKGRFVDRWQAMEIAYVAGQVLSEERAMKADYSGDLVASEVFQAQEPHDRDITGDSYGWNMLYSEDIY